MPTGKTYDQLVTANAQKDPVGLTVAGAGMVGLGYVTGGATTAVGVKLFGAAVGAGMNYLFQSGPTDWVDVGFAGTTGFITTGAGLGSSVLTNAGGALFSSAIKGENPNAGIGAAAVGTVAGYSIGKGIEIPLNNQINPWWRPTWTNKGLGITTFTPPSAIPGMIGGVGSSFAQEPTGNFVKEEIQRAWKN